MEGVREQAKGLKHALALLHIPIITCDTIVLIGSITPQKHTTSQCGNNTQHKVASIAKCQQYHFLKEFETFFFGC